MEASLNIPHSKKGSCYVWNRESADESTFVEKLICKCMDRTFNSLRVFARPELRKNVRALPCKLHHGLHLHRLPPQVVSLIEDGTTIHIVRQ